MGFKDFLQSGPGIETLIIKLSKDIADLTNDNVAEHISDELLKGTRKSTDGLELVLYSTLTGKDVDEDENYKKTIEEYKELNPKFKSICLRMKMALENIKKAQKK
jgi:hypothetical protein